MEIFSFYRRKADFILRTKFITFKLFYANYYLKNFFFEFKTSSGISSGGFILLYAILLRFSTMQIKKMFKSIQSLTAYNKTAPEIKANFSFYNFRGSKDKSKLFRYLFFLSHPQVVLAEHGVLQQESLVSESSLTVSDYSKSFQQTFLGFSSHMLGGLKFAEVYYSFFWKTTSQFSTAPNFWLQKEVLPNTQSSLFLRRDFQQYIDPVLIKKTMPINFKFYFQLAKDRLFDKHKILTNFVFSNSFNRVLFFS